MLTYRYRLYPTKSQQTSLQGVLDACLWVYNETLKVRKESWEQDQKSLSLYDTVSMIPAWKKQNPFLKKAHSQVLQQVSIRVDLAFQAFFKRVKSGKKPGYPKFHDQGSYRSFTFTQSGFSLDGSYLRLSKIGSVKIKYHRPIEGNTKTLTVVRNVLGEWFACFSTEVEEKPLPLPPLPHSVGIDLGINHFATLSTGETIGNPRFFRKDEKDLAKAQRLLSNTKRGSKEHKKYLHRVRKIHKRIRNRRDNFCHQTSRRIVDAFQVIAVEDLDVKNMTNVGFRGLNKSIQDVSWSTFVAFTEYKSKKAQRAFVKVDPKGTSQECHNCGEIVPKDLSIRVHSCSNCKCELDRDLNAALNILGRGLASLGENP